MIRGAVIMYTMNETELWRQRRDELMREAEHQRLGRQQRMSRKGNASHGRRPLLARMRAAFRPVSEKEANLEANVEANVADCRG
jgi:hypothetical protein